MRKASAFCIFALMMRMNALERAGAGAFLLICLCSTVGASQSASGDTAAVLTALWRQLNRDGSTAVPRLFMPNDQGHGAIGVSDEVRAILTRSGIPVSSTRPAGDDTIVFRVVRWTTERSGSVLVEFRSESTTILGTGTRQCRARSGSAGSYRIHRAHDGWVTELVGPVIAGDDICRPVQSSPPTLGSLVESMTDGPARGPYPTTNLPVTLASGTVVRVRNLVVFHGNNTRQLTIMIETPTPVTDNRRLADEARQLAVVYRQYADNEQIDGITISLCRTQACLELREVPTERFHFTRGANGAWTP